MKTITLIPGDGIGPEISEAMKRCVEAAGVQIKWDEQQAGAMAYEKTGELLPRKTLDSIKKNKVAIKGPVTTPIGSGFRSVNVLLRKELDLYQNIRPARSFEGIPNSVQGVNLVIFRENTDDVYVGVEFEKGKKETLEIIKEIQKRNPAGEVIRDDSGISIKSISAFKSERIVKAAFEYALKYKRKKVTCGHKANILKFSDGLFLERAQKIAPSYPSVGFEDRIIDNLCMQLVQRWWEYDILVLPNLYGDIVSDLCAGLIGGLGVAPGANIGDAYAVFEAVHGSAPKYARKNKVNPTALILSAVMMLRHIGEEKAAAKLENAVAAVIKEGKNVTYDLKPKRDDPSAVGTREMADAIIAKMKGG